MRSDPEGNTRFPQQLAQIGRGWAVLIGSDVVTLDGIKLAYRVGLDCIPRSRFAVLLALVKGKNPYSRDAVDLPPVLINRAVEDLQAVGLVTSDKGAAKLSVLANQLVKGAGLER